MNTTTTQRTRFVAKCTCGWVSPIRINPNDAITLGEAHLINRCKSKSVYAVHEVLA